jgi:hypothetical protein
VSLLKKMLDQDSRPDTLDGWQDLAIKYQGKWLEAQHELAQRDSKDPNKQKVYLLKLINLKHSNYSMSILKTAWTWMSPKQWMTRERSESASIVKNPGMAGRIARSASWMKPGGRNHKHKCIKLKSLMKKRRCHCSHKERCQSYEES